MSDLKRDKDGRLLESFLEKWMRHVPLGRRIELINDACELAEDQFGRGVDSVTDIYMDKTEKT